MNLKYSLAISVTAYATAILFFAGILTAGISGRSEENNGPIYMANETPEMPGLVPDRIIAMFKSMDANGDVQVSRDEFIGEDWMFSILDANHDGYISADEAAQSAEALRGLKPRKKNGAVAQDIVAMTNVIYKTVAGHMLTLDLFRVDGRTYTNTPLAIYIHGGGYVAGDKQQVAKYFPAIFLPLLRSPGYQVASINYRLCVPHKTTLLDCGVDCKDAVRFLAKNGVRYGIDTNRIVAFGTSAGGNLALLLALTGDKDLPGDLGLASYSASVKCAISWFGMTDFTRSDVIEKYHTQENLFFTSVSSGDLREAEAASPVWYMKRNGLKPWLLLLQGDDDAIVPLQQAEWMDSQAKALNVPLKLVIVKNAGHEFHPVGGTISPTRQQIERMTLTFILQHNH